MRNVSHHHKQGKQQQTSRAKRWIGWGASLLICLHGTLAWAGHAFYDYANPLPAAEIEVVYSAWTSYPYGGLNNPYPSAAAACAVNKLSLIAGFVGTSPSAGAASCAYGFNCYYNLQDCLFTNYNFPGDIGITTSGNAYQIPSCPAGYTMMTRPTGQFACRKNNSIPDCPTPKIRPDIAFKFVAFTQNYGSVYPGICERWYCPNPAENPVSQNQGGITVMECVPNETYTLTLTPGTSPIEPGQSSTLTVEVTKQDGTAPSIPVPVTLKVEVDATSGGHDHGETFAPRPKGSLSTTSGNTKFPVTFTSTEISGKHTITATCDLCSNNPKTATVEVKVKESEQAGWDSLTASPGDYELVGGETGKKHHDNHYLTAHARDNLQAIVEAYNKAYPNGPVLHLNDASLVWGGKFDISGKWSGDHAAHRRGKEIDIRANQEPTAISFWRFADFIEIAKDNGASAKVHCNFPKAYSWACWLDTGVNRHFHVYLGK